MITAVLTDLLFLCFVLSVGFCGGWLACGIFAAAKLRRIRLETWREASAHFAKRMHDLTSGKG